MRSVLRLCLKSFLNKGLLITGPVALVTVWLVVPGETRAGEPPAEAVWQELARHQGTWRASSFVWDGTASRPDVVASIVRVVEHDHVAWRRDGKNFAGTTVVLDPTRVPATIDVIPDGGPSRGQRVAGIYRLNEDSLTLCMAAPGAIRPGEFLADKGSGRTLMTFRRERPDDSSSRPKGR